MGCSKCNKRRAAFKKKIVEAKVEIKSMTNKDKSELKAKEHFMKVCIHGVPDKRYCQGCKKVISIPEDAKIKSEQFLDATKPLEQAK